MKLSFIWIAVVLAGLTLPAQCAQAAGGPNGASADHRPSQNISGTLLDPSGAAIAQARVFLLGTDGKPRTQVTTDSAGTFHFDNIVPGNYVLDFHAEGFRDIRVSATLTGKRANPLRVILQIEVPTENVTVATGDAVPTVSTEAAENQNANTIDRDALDRMPVFDQDYIATMSRFLDDNATGTNGVTLVVNGVEANGPGVTPSAIQEVKINQNPYSARFSRPGRARLEIITKGGTPEYHGSLNFLFRDSVFDARNAFAAVKPPERRQYYEGSITGPIGHGKRTSFLLSLDEDLNDQQSFVVADILVNNAETPLNENVPNPTHHFFGSGRIFHDAANGDQFWIGYSYEHRSVKNNLVGGSTLPSAGTNTSLLEHEINVSYLHQLSSRWVNQLRFLVGHFDSPTTSVTSAPQIVVSGAFTGGGAQADSRRTEYHLDGTDFLTYASGKHQVIFGLDIPDLSRRGFDDFTNRAGTTTYGSLADYMTGHASTYLVQSGQGHLVFLEKTFAGFIEDSIRVRPNLSLYMGMRYYWQNYFHDDSDNFAPRIGFAWAPTPNSKNVVRGGAGIFFDRTGPSPVADLLRFNGVNLRRYIVNNPTTIPPSLTGVPTSVVVLDPRAHIPYVVQYSVGIEHQVTAKSTLAVTYVGTRGIDQFRSIDANAPLPPKYDSRPNLNLGQQRELQSEGYLKGHSLEVTFRGKPSRYFSGQVQYTLGKTYNNTSGITYFPGNSYNPAADWARSDNDRRHKFDLLASTHPTKFFTLGVALSLYSDKPVNVTTGADNNQDGITNDRPAGYSRNSMHGPGLVNLDLNLSHDFRLTKAKKEAKELTVSLNSFNVFNHTNDATYVGVLSSSFFGHANAALPPRRIQLDLQFKF